MSRLVSMFMLWLLLLHAAAPASAVMDVQPRNGTWEIEVSGYDVAPDVRDGPNLYAYVQQNPWTGWDPDGLATDQDQAMDFEGGGGRGSFITGGSDNRSLDLRYFVRPVQPQSSNSRATTSPKPASTNSPKPNAGPDQVQPKTNTTATEPAPAARGSNNTVTNSAAKTGQEAHRQTQKELREQGYQTEVPVTLKNGQQVRKDAIKDNESVIIKPDTATGRKAAEAREKLLKEQSNLEPKTKLYDPQDPKFQPGSPTFIGPKPKPAKKSRATS